MKFEPFDGTKDVGKKVSHMDGVDRTTCSEGSRRDARPIRPEPQFLTATDEYHVLLRKMADVEKKLAAAKLSAHGPRSPALVPLKKRKIDLQARMAELKSRYAAERETDAAARNRPERERGWELMERQVALLVEIRDLLRDLDRKWS